MTNDLNQDNDEDIVAIDAKPEIEKTKIITQDTKLDTKTVKQSAKLDNKPRDKTVATDIKTIEALTNIAKKHSLDIAKTQLDVQKNLQSLNSIITAQAQSADLITGNIEVIDSNLSSIKVVVAELEETADKISRQGSSSNAEITKSIKLLHDQVFILRKLPEKIEDNLKAMAPDIAKAVHQEQQDLLVKLNENIQICSSNLNIFAASSQKLIDDTIVKANTTLEEIAVKSTKLLSGFTGFLINNGMAAAIAVAASYLMIKYNPVSVHIDTRGTMNIRDSKINVLGGLEKTSNPDKPANNK